MCFVTPKEGTALVFNHDTLHEGLPVTDGVKYIVRTEVMYHRVDREMILNPFSYRKSENYLITLALYQKSWQLEQGTSIGITYGNMYTRIQVKKVPLSLIYVHETQYSALPLHVHPSIFNAHFTGFSWIHVRTYTYILLVWCFAY